MKTLLETLKRKWAEYLLETIVIIIGILGAFALNNWKESVNQKKETAKIYQLIESDLEFSIAEIDSILSEYDSSITDMTSILLNEVTKEDMMNDRKYFGSVTGFEDIRIKTRGIELLENSIALDIDANDSLANKISNFYSDKTVEFEADLKVLEQVFQDFFGYYSSQDWFYDLITGKGLEGFADEASGNQEFRKKMLAYSLALASFRTQLSDFRDEAKVILEEIDKYQQENQ